MTTPVAAAVGAVVAALQATPAVCVVVDRVRLRPVDKSTTLAVAVRPLQGSVVETSLQGHPVHLRTALAVDCYARAEPGVSPDLALDPLVQATVNRLLADTTLGGAVVQLQFKDYGFDFDTDAQQTACASLVFELIHRTSGGPSFEQPT